MNRQTAENYLSRLIELGFDMEEFGDTNWFYGESKKKEYMAHVILEDDKALDNTYNMFYDRVRIWSTKNDIQIEVPKLEELTLAQLDINSLKCQKCGQTVANVKHLTVTNFDCGYCRDCMRLK